MSTTVSNQHRICATCNLWAGPRIAKLPYPSIFVETDSYAKGECMGGGFRYMQMNAIATCGQYQKWAVLR